VKWFRTGWWLVRGWRGIIGALPRAVLLPKSPSISGIPIFGRGGLVIADDGNQIFQLVFKAAAVATCYGR